MDSLHDRERIQVTLATCSLGESDRAHTSALLSDLAKNLALKNITLEGFFAGEKLIKN